MHTIALSLFLSILPPVLDIPVELELCMLKAELCAEDAAPMLGMCIGVDEPALEQCIEDYEDCAYGLPMASDASCQAERTWCALEAPFWLDNDDGTLLKHCTEIAEICPAY